MKEPQKKSRKKKLYTTAAVTEISVDAVLATFLSELDDIFALKEQRETAQGHKTDGDNMFCFTPVWLRQGFRRRPWCIAASRGAVTNVRR